MNIFEMNKVQVSLLTSVLDWWEEHQYDTFGGDYNVYDDEPNFVKDAKKLWVYLIGKENPYNWTWLNSDGFI